MGRWLSKAEGDWSVDKKKKKKILQKVQEKSLPPGFLQT